MPQDPKPLQCDILAPDDVVVLLDGTPKAVVDSIHNSDSLKTLNYRLLSIKSSELNDAVKVRQIILNSLTSIETGLFDSMFSQAAILAPEPGVERYKTASSIRDRSLSQLRQLLNDQKAFDTLVQQGKTIVANIRSVGIHATTDEQREKAAQMLASDNSPITASMERLFTAERIPFVIYSDANANAHERHTKHGGLLRPSDAAHVYLPAELLEHKPSKHNIAPLAFSQIVLDQLTSKRLGILPDAEIPFIAGTDQARMRYNVERKRKEIEKHNKSSSSPICMFPDAIRAARLKANSINTDHEYDSNTSQLAELHHLLTYYKGKPVEAKILDRFEHAQSYHSAIMQALDERIDARLQAKEAFKEKRILFHGEPIPAKHFKQAYENLLED